MRFPSLHTRISSDRNLVKPTSTLSAAAYAACTDYASILSSCASATTSFYHLAPSEQARCACYVPTTTSTWCSPSGTAKPTTLDLDMTTEFAQSVSVSARATSRFDNAADACYGYFNAQGYTALANVLAGSNSKNETRLGWQFCANINEEIIRATPATTTNAYIPASGLPYTANPTPYGECKVSYYSRPSNPNVASGLNSFDRLILVRVWTLLVVVIY